ALGINQPCTLATDDGHHRNALVIVHLGARMPHVLQVARSERGIAVFGKIHPAIIDARAMHAQVCAWHRRKPTLENSAKCPDRRGLARRVRRRAAVVPAGALGDTMDRAAVARTAPAAGARFAVEWPG